MALNLLDRPRRPRLPMDVLPDVHLPDMHLPDVHLPDVHLPDVTVRRDRALRRAGGPGRRWVLAGLAAAAGFGAVAAYLADPKLGRGRRARLLDQLGGAARRVQRTADRQVRQSTGVTIGIRERLRPTRDEADLPADEVELAHRVETELYRDSSVEKGRLSINAERDVVFLRGTVENPAEIEATESRVRAIPGVRTVVNLLHAPETAAPQQPAEGGWRVG